MFDVQHADSRRKIVSMMITKGMSTAAIANRIGVPIKTIRTDRLMLSVPNPEEVLRQAPERSTLAMKAKTYAYSPMDIQARRNSVAKLHGEGKNDAEIARSLQVPTMAVFRDRKALNLERISNEEETLERRANVRKMFDEGMECAEIAKELGISKMTVLRDRKHMGLTALSAEQESAITERRSKVAVMVKSDMNYKQIASALGMSEMMVSRDCEAMGLTSLKSKASVAEKTAERRVTVREMFTAGSDVNEIASRLDVHPMTVRRDLASIGLK